LGGRPFQEGSDPMHLLQFLSLLADAFERSREGQLFALGALTALLVRNRRAR
jgi:hypothetical protein